MPSSVWKQTCLTAVDSLRAVWRSGVQLMLPPRCALCDLDLADETAAGDTFCAACRATLISETRAACPKCGLAIAIGTRGDCPNCAGRRFAFERVARAGTYEGPLREAVLRAKNLAGEPVGAALGCWLAQCASEQWDDVLRTDGLLVTCVPSYWLRRLRRGTNSAAVIAQTLAAELKLPTGLDLLVCRKSIEKQSSLPPSERRRNVRGAFRVSWGYDIRGATILLVDDVLTTGATAQEIARMLRRAGAARVLVAVVARALGPDW